MSLHSLRGSAADIRASRSFSGGESSGALEMRRSEEAVGESSFERVSTPALRLVPSVEVLPGALALPGAGPGRAAEDAVVALIEGRGDHNSGLPLWVRLASLSGPALNRVLGRVPLERLLDQFDYYSPIYVLPNERLEVLGTRARELSGPVLTELLSTLFKTPSCRNPELAIRLLKGLGPSTVRQVTEGLELLDPVAGLSEVVSTLVGRARVGEAAMILGGVLPPEGGAERRVFADIDDTVVCGWKDTRYPKHVIYPGATTFLRKLRQSVSGHQDKGLGVAFLSARPDDCFGVMRWFTTCALQDTGLSNATRLLGGFLHVYPEGRIIGKKFQNFMDYIRWFPEGRFVFVGDSGQKDTEVGLTMLEAAPGQMSGVFIHRVTDVPLARREELAAKRVWLFDNYVEAAELALAEGILSDEDAVEVVFAAVEEFGELRFSCPKTRAARLGELRDSVSRFNDRALLSSESCTQQAA